MSWRQLALLLALPFAAPAQASPLGLWQNPAKSVVVRTSMCGPTLCGTIVEASAQARADAHDAGIDELIGVSLLRSYRQTGPGAWEGHVFVPDMGHVFFSRIAELSPNQIRISGCILGGLLCKSQVWTRL
jgi:uncharacterized protein (DUF2147 family)